MGKQGKLTKFKREKGDRDRPETEEDFRRRELEENENKTVKDEENEENENENEEEEEKEEKKEEKKPKKAPKEEKKEKKEEKKPKKAAPEKEEEEKDEAAEKKPKEKKGKKAEKPAKEGEKKEEKAPAAEGEEGEKKEQEEEYEVRVEKVERDPKVKITPIYCGVCGWPIEYCEFNNKWEECRVWLEEHHPKVCEELTALREKDKNKDKKVKNKPAGEKPKALTGQEEIIITVQPRQKKKYITSVEGLAAFGINMKDMAKTLSKKFSSGCSVFKRDDGAEGVEMQGNFRDKVFGILLKEYKIDQTKIFYMEITKDEEGKIIKKKKPMRVNMAPKKKEESESDDDDDEDDDDEDAE